MVECCLKRGQNCNNSCRLLRNTECFPAIWINKHSLDPLRPRLSFSPNVFVGVPSAAPSNRTCFQLTVMKEETTASLRFLASGTAALGPELLFCISSLAICLFPWIQINRSHIASALLLRSPWGDQHPALVSHRGLWHHSDLSGSSLPLHHPTVVGLLQSDRHFQPVQPPARRTFHFSFSPTA